MTIEAAADCFAATRKESDFLVLHTRVGPRLWLFCLRLVGWSHVNAEELMQETWLRAIRLIGARRRESRFCTWLFGIALNVDRERRRGQRVESHEHEALLEPAFEPSTEAFDLELEGCLARLSGGARVVLLLHDLEGYTHTEIGAMLGIAVGTSKSQLHAARRAMRSLLDTPERTLDGANDETR